MKLGSKEYILGVAVTHRSVHGVLIRRTGDGATVIRHIDRPRVSMEGLSPSEAVGFQAIEDHDPEVSFAAGAADDANGLFLASEFAEADPAATMADGGVAPSTVEIELTDILDECYEAGAVDPEVIFCVGSTDLDYHNITVNTRSNSAVGGDRQPKRSKGRKRPENGKLLQHLAASTDAKFDPDGTVFLPMTPSVDRQTRYLAVCTRDSEVIIPTLRRMAARKRRISVGIVETEVSLLLGVVRTMTSDADEGRSPATRLALRVGADDTLVLFLEGQNIVHAESLRSITSFESADTVCSRLLLMQDEQGFADPDEILVLGEENEASLTRRLTEFFEDSEVRCMRNALPRSEDDLDEEYSREATLAAATLVRALADPAGKQVFEPVNLLPRKLFRRGVSLKGLKWQAMPMFILLFASTLFFTQRYINQSQQTAQLERKLAEYPVALIENNREDIQSQIDSINAVTNGYIEALAVLDSILVGSDKWSRTMERTAREAATIPGIWIEAWEEDSQALSLQGTATNRDQIVRYAARMDGVIESVSFDQIREWPVYKFSMKVPLPNELPAAARYLRERPEEATE